MLRYARLTATIIRGMAKEGSPHFNSAVAELLIRQGEVPNTGNNTRRPNPKPKAQPKVSPGPGGEASGSTGETGTETSNTQQQDLIARIEALRTGSGDSA